MNVQITSLCLWNIWNGSKLEIDLRGFKLRLKGIFELDLQNGNVNEDLSTVEANIC
jgi:hypothetical protein